MRAATRRHMLEVAHCPIVARCLSEENPMDKCAKVVLSQWEGRTTQERLRHWRRFHQLPTPWIGHLETAPLLFVSSNPSIGGKLRPDLDVAPDKEHWITSKTDDDLIVKRYEETFARHATDAALAKAAAGQRYWSSIRNRAQELFDEGVVEGRHYALTEVVRCGSVNERIGGVLTAARVCVPEYLKTTLELSGARVIIGVGDHALRGLPKVLPVRADGGVQEVALADRTVLVSFLPGPGAGKGKTFEKTHDEEQRERLKAALREALPAQPS